MPSRRTVVAGLAAAPALAVPVTASALPADPIFAAIARTTASYARIEATDEAADREGWRAADAEMHAAVVAVYRTMPATVAGAAAFAAFADTDNQPDDFDDPRNRALQLLAGALARLAGGRGL